MVPPFALHLVEVMPLPAPPRPAPLSLRRPLQSEAGQLRTFGVSALGWTLRILGAGEGDG